MSRPMWFVNLLKKSFPQRFRIARMTRLPLIGALMDWALFEGDELIYLPANQTIQINEAIPQPEDVALPSQVVEHFIEQARYHWRMDFCICREANPCDDYPRDLGCLFLGEAVLQINPKLGRLVSKEEALDHVQACREAGLVHVVGRNKLDVMWLGAGPGEKLLTICNCCPCCCLWKILPETGARIGSKVKRLPGVSVRVNELCMGCGLCVEEVCFVDAIRMVDGVAEIGVQCRGCGRCVQTCPVEAIELRIDEGAVVEDAIRRLSGFVDVR